MVNPHLAVKVSYIVGLELSLFKHTAYHRLHLHLYQLTLENTSTVFYWLIAVPQIVTALR